MYSEITVVVNGALEEEQIFYDYVLEQEFLAHIEVDAIDHGYPTEVYRMVHDHELMEEECFCLQYLTDLNPIATYNQRAA